MTRISSRITWTCKWLPPLFLAGIGAVMTPLFLMESPPNVMLALVVFVFSFGCAWFHYLMYRHVADRVDDGADHLLVRRGGHEEAIALRDIAAVTWRSMGSGWAPSVLDVRLLRTTTFGNEITFIPPQGGWSLDPSRALREDLQARSLRLRKHQKTP